jgi:hypothetical protein
VVSKPRNAFAGRSGLAGSRAAWERGAADTALSIAPHRANTAINTRTNHQTFMDVLLRSPQTVDDRYNDDRGERHGGREVRNEACAASA